MDSLTAEETLKLETYFFNTDEEEKKAIFERARKIIIDNYDKNDKTVKKLNLLLAGLLTATDFNTLTMGRSALGKLHSLPEQKQKTVSDEQVMKLLKAFDLRRHNREVQDKKDQRNNRRNKK